MSTQTTDLTAWLDELDAARRDAWDDALESHRQLTAALRAVLALADELRRDAAAEERFPDGTKFAAGLTYTADRIRAVVAAAHTEEGR